MRRLQRSPSTLRRIWNKVWGPEPFRCELCGWIYPETSKRISEGQWLCAERCWKPLDRVELLIAESERLAEVSTIFEPPPERPVKTGWDQPMVWGFKEPASRVVQPGGEITYLIIGSLLTPESINFEPSGFEAVHSFILSGDDLLLTITIDPATIPGNYSFSVNGMRVREGIQVRS
jgi:hypothetical protein